MMTEARIQQECVMWFDNTYGRFGRGFIAHIPNGGSRSSRIEGNLLKAQGVKAGVPDLFVLLPNGHTLWIEMKTPKGDVRKEQKQFMQQAALLGHAVHIIRTIEDFQTLIKTQICQGG
jgi:hypothetical protein